MVGGAAPADRSRGSDPVYLGKTVCGWGLNNAGEGITGIKRSVSFLLTFHHLCCLLECRCLAGLATVNAFLVLVGLRNDCCNEAFSLRLEKLQKVLNHAEFLLHGRLYPLPSLFRWRGPDAEEQQQQNLLPCATPACWHPPGTPEGRDAAAALLQG